MITSTFQCFDGVGPGGESRLWETGCLGWNDFLRGTGTCLSPAKQKSVAAQIRAAQSARQARLADWFLLRLKGRARLRVLHEFLAEALFLDIETTGLGPRDTITSIGVCKNGETRVYVDGFNLHRFTETLRDTRLLVTYNGNRFDLPVIRRCLGLELGIPHLDLMPPLRALGYSGGLKRCETLAGLVRPTETAGVDGAEAVQLWHRWQNHNDRDALRTLVLYNAEDARNLAVLAARLFPKAMDPFPMIPRMPDPHPVQTKNILDFLAL